MQHGMKQWWGMTTLAIGAGDKPGLISIGDDCGRGLGVYENEHHRMDACAEIQDPIDSRLHVPSACEDWGIRPKFSMATARRGWELQSFGKPQ